MPKYIAYLHENGKVQVKCYLGIEQIEEFKESNFVINFTEPFDAQTRNGAKFIANRKLYPNKSYIVEKKKRIKLSL